MHQQSWRGHLQSKAGKRRSGRRDVRSGEGSGELGGSREGVGEVKEREVKEG